MITQTFSIPDFEKNVTSEKTMNNIKSLRKPHQKSLWSDPHAHMEVLIYIMVATLMAIYYDYLTLGELRAYPQYNNITLSFMHTKYNIDVVNETRTIIKGNHESDKKYILEDEYQKRMGGIFFMNSSLERTNATYIDLMYVYVCAFGGCVQSDGKIYLPERDRIFLKLGEAGQVVGYYEHVAASGNRWAAMYAHWMYDCVAYLLFIPEEIRKKSVFLLPVNSTIYSEAVETLGFNKSLGQILYLNSSQWVFARHFHTVYTPESIHGCMIWAVHELGRKWKELYGLNATVPTDYALYNRPYGNRYIIEFDDFCYSIQMRFPEYRWIKLQTLYPTFKESVIAYSHVKLLFAPAGSNWANVIFMNKNTAAVCAMADTNDIPVLAVCEVMNIWLSTFPIPGMRHHGGVSGKMDLEIAIKAVQKALFALDHGRWPTTTEI